MNDAGDSGGRGSETHAAHVIEGEVEATRDDEDEAAVQGDAALGAVGDQPGRRGRSCLMTNLTTTETKTNEVDVSPPHR